MMHPHDTVLLPGSPDLLIAGVDERTRMTLATNLRGAFMEARSWWGPAVPCTLFGREKNPLWLYFSAFVRNPKLLGIKEMEGMEVLHLGSLLEDDVE
jgi:hypothetical protein